MPLDTLWHDLRHALRAWRSQPSLYAIALAALALGIGCRSEWNWDSCTKA